jgi:hypothetical protein
MAVTSGTANTSHASRKESRQVNFWVNVKPGSITMVFMLQLSNEVMDHRHDVTAFTGASHEIRDHQCVWVFVFEVIYPAGNQSGLPTTTFSR